MVTKGQVKDTVTGADPYETFVVPLGFGDFYQAPELENIAQRLIEDKELNLPPRLAAGDSGYKIVYLWKTKGGKSSGKAIYGKCVKTSGLAGYFSGADFVIWLAADYVKELQFSNYQVEALLFHELLHITLEVDEETDEVSLNLTGHDFEGFTREVEEYGFWDASFVGMSRSVQGRLAFAPDINRTARGLKELVDDPANGITGITFSTPEDSVTIGKKP